MSLLPHRSASFLAALLALAAACRGTARPDGRSASASPLAPLPAMPWAPLYFPGYDSVTTAAGLPPLRAASLPPGDREVRVWVSTPFGAPNVLYRFRDHRGVVTGTRYDYWPALPADTAAGERPGETIHDLMVYRLRGQCAGVRVAGGTGLCRARFQESPDWAAVLRGAEAFGLWTLPDPSTRAWRRPWDGSVPADGSALTVELRDGAAYRTYQYRGLPSHLRRLDPARLEGPTELSAVAIADTVRSVDALLHPRDVLRVYRGVTLGEPGSAFRPCGADESWEFQGDLRASAAAQRLALPTPASGGARDRGYYVEVFAQPTPEWLARRQGSKYPRILQAFYVMEARPWTGAECGRGR